MSVFGECGKIKERRPNRWGLTEQRAVMREARERRTPKAPETVLL